ncbi:MAG TPA: PEGA domain-containing protein [Rubricoccaceae bacterium]|jgi:hypothetical protein
MRVVSALAFSALLFTNSGCSTIIHGTRQGVAVNSEPPGATVLIDGIPMGQTPTTLNLKRGDDHQVTFQLAGYQDTALLIEKEFDLVPTVIGNVFSWGLIGLVVDLANGAAYRLEPEELRAMLTAQGTAVVPTSDPDEVTVVLFSQEEVAAVLGN